MWEKGSDTRGWRPRANAGGGGVYFWIYGGILQRAGPIRTAVMASAVLGALRNTPFLQSLESDKALSHPGLDLMEALLTRLTDTEVDASSGRRGAQGLTAARGKTLGWGGDRKAWGGTLCLEVTTWAGCSGLLCGRPQQAQGVPFLIGSVEKEMWFPRGERKIYPGIG